VGLVFQDAESQLFADTVLEDVEFGPRNLGVSAADAAAASRDALAAVGLEPEVYGARSPFTLSGGEARRAAIAGVLAMRPRYLLADEPTAGLDASGRRALRALLSEARAAAGVVVVSHAADEFLGAADRVLILEAGRSAWYGSADDVIRHPEIIVEHGLVPPDVLEVQRIAASHGLDAGPFTLDPASAATALARAGGWG
jgi:energy-coupling factor transport system ATP-binding protein